MIQVYAVLKRAPRKKPRRGASGEPVRFVEVGPLVVAAGSLDAAPSLSKEQLLSHDRLVRELAAATDAILPARWGSVFADDAAVAEAIGLQSAALVAALEQVRGCEQMTLRFAGQALSVPARVRSSGKDYLEARARERAAARSAPEIEPLRAALAPLVRGERVERPATTLLVAVHHLVGRGRAEDYRAAAASADLAFALRVSGPDPPYAFAPEVGA